MVGGCGSIKRWGEKGEEDKRDGRTRMPEALRTVEAVFSDHDDVISWGEDLRYMVFQNYYSIAASLWTLIIINYWWSSYFEQSSVCALSNQTDFELTVKILFRLFPKMLYLYEMSVWVVLNSWSPQIHSICTYKETPFTLRISSYQGPNSNGML